MIKTKKTNCVLGISISHNASANYVKVKFYFVARGRLTNKKNFFGYPKKSDYCINFAKKSFKIDKAVFTHKSFQFLT